MACKNPFCLTFCFHHCLENALNPLLKQTICVCFNDNFLWNVYLVFIKLFKVTTSKFIKLFTLCNLDGVILDICILTNEHVQYMFCEYVLVSAISVSGTCVFPCSMSPSSFPVV